MMRQKVIGMLLIVVSLGTLGFWEFWGRENLSYAKVLVLSQDTARNTLIEKNMLEVRRMDEPEGPVLREEDAARLIGLETAQYVPAGTPLYGEYFQDPALAVGGETGQYILSIPNQWLMSFPQTLRRGDEVSFYCEGKLVTSALVAYVRDSSNQEVISDDDARLQASAPVSLVEVVVTEEKALKLGKLGDEGKRFVLLYS
ncbi:MAG: SAF domain-containing protein [Firmicutes bacterium]|nr:SAF domain-containing protein [Bacillota bacterium]